MGPTLAVSRHRFRRQAGVSEAHQGIAVIRQQINFNQRGTWRYIVVVALPAPGISQARDRHYFLKLSASYPARIDVDQKYPTGTRVEFGRDTHPPYQPLWISKERKHRRSIRTNRELALDCICGIHHLPLALMTRELRAPESFNLFDEIQRC